MTTVLLLVVARTMLIDLIFLRLVGMEILQPKTGYMGEAAAAYSLRMAMSLAPYGAVVTG